MEYDKKTGNGIIRDANNQKIKFKDFSIAKTKKLTDQVCFKIILTQNGLIATELC